MKKIVDVPSHALSFCILSVQKYCFLDKHTLSVGNQGLEHAAGLGSCLSELRLVP